MKNMIQSKRASNKVKGGLILGLILCFCAHDTKGSGDLPSHAFELSKNYEKRMKSMRQLRHASMKKFPDKFAARIEYSGDESLALGDPSEVALDEGAIMTMLAGIAKIAQEKAKALRSWIIWD